MQQQLPPQPFGTNFVPTRNKHPLTTINQGLSGKLPERPFLFFTKNQRSMAMMYADARIFAHAVLFAANFSTKVFHRTRKKRRSLTYDKP